MRALITGILSIFMIGCASAIPAQKNQINHDISHPVCEISEKFAHTIQSKMDKNGGGTSVVRYCGALADTKNILGIAIVEVVVPLPLDNGSMRHIFMLLKFARKGSEWEVLGEPEYVVDFTHESVVQHTPDTKKQIRL
jgi:hypothetical protein